MLQRYQDLALRLASRLVQREDLDETDLRVLKAYFILAADDDAPPPGPRDQTATQTEAVSPPKGVAAALLPWGTLLGKAQPKVEPDPLLLGLMIAFFAWVIYLLARRS
jgi:hypothetical protein